MHLSYFAAGFSKAVDPLSGMTVNLAVIQQGLSEMKDSFESQDFPDFLNALKSHRDFLANFISRLQSEGTGGAHVTSAQFRFLDGSILRWHSDSENSGVFTFEKSGATVLTDLAGRPKKLRILKILFRITSDSELLQAREFVIPSVFSLPDPPEEELLAELNRKTDLGLFKLELWDPMARVAQVVRAAQASQVVGGSGFKRCEG